MPSGSPFDHTSGNNNGVNNGSIVTKLFLDVSTFHDTAYQILPLSQELSTGTLSILQMHKSRLRPVTQHASSNRAGMVDSGLNLTAVCHQHLNP